MPRQKKIQKTSKKKDKIRIRQRTARPCNLNFFVVMPNQFADEARRRLGLRRFEPINAKLTSNPPPPAPRCRAAPPNSDEAAVCA